MSDYFDDKDNTPFAQAMRRTRELERERDELRRELDIVKRDYESYIADKKLQRREANLETLQEFRTLTEALRSAENTLALMAEGEGDRAEVYQQMSKAELAEVRAALAKAGVDEKYGKGK